MITNKLYKMKRILIIATLIVMSLQTMAQRGGDPNWISIAGKVGVGNSILFSEQISDDGNITQNYLSPAISVGGRLGVVFVDRVGVSVEYLSSTYSNKYEVCTPGGNKRFDSNLKFKTGDLLVLARYTGEYGFYAEIGPKFTSIKEAQYSIEDNPNGVTYGDLLTTAGPISNDPISNLDLTNCFNGKFTSIVFGLGYAVFNGDRVQVTLGARAAYCSKNIIKQVDGLQNTGFSKYTTMEMKPFSAQVMVDINYHFARFGSATCGKQKIIFFK